MARLVDVTDGTFEHEVLDAEVPVLVDFWAPWCGPCKAIAPMLDEIAEEYDGKLRIVKLDIDANPTTAIEYRVRSIPTLVVFKDGGEAERLIGAVSKEALLARLRQHSAAPAIA